MKTNISIYLTTKVIKTVKKLSIKEKRSFSSMCLFLLEESLKRRSNRG